MIRKNIALFCLGFAAAPLFISCTSMQRSDRSGYSGDNASGGNSNGSQGAGWFGGGDEDASQTQRRIQILESRLESKREKEQYSKVLPWLRDDEKVEFLKLPTVDARQAWINSNAIWKRAQAPSSEQKEAIDANDIAVGMQMDYVRKSWGEPQSVEVSGNPLYKNERWKYTRSISTPDGFKQERRLIYFEGGKVVGWDTDRF